MSAPRHSDYSLSAAREQFSPADRRVRVREVLAPAGFIFRSHSPGDGETRYKVAHLPDAESGRPDYFGIPSTRTVFRTRSLRELEAFAEGVKAERVRSREVAP